MLKTALKNLLLKDNFNPEYMDIKNPNYWLYEKIQKIMEDSGISYNFSFRIAEKAIEALVACGDWTNDYLIREEILNIIPIYTNELMQIYIYDGDRINVVTEGITDITSEERAKKAWYYLILEMVTEIIYTLDATLS